MENIYYSNNLEEVKDYKLGNFFVGWKNKPSQDIFWKLLKKSDKFICAVDKDNNMIIGYITAISDGVLSAYIPFLEVDEKYQNKGIGSELLKRIVKDLNNMYMVDLVCDKEKAGFYEKVGMRKWNAMILRNFNNQSGKEI